MAKDGATKTGTKKPGAGGEFAGAPTGGSNSPTQFLNPKAKAGPEAVPGVCTARGCKHKSTRFAFCDEHYEHFKFGLIKKTGEMVPDYEKKIEHFHAMKAREKQVARKVA